MRKILVACAAVVLLCGGSVGADPSPWGMGFDFLVAPLSGDDDDYVESGGGVDLYGTYGWSDFLTQRFGFNALEYEGHQHFSSAGRGIEPDRVAVRALYTGVQLHTAPKEGFGFYGRFDLGFSSLSDINQTVTVGTQVLGTERAFDGGRDLYLGVGLGATYQWNERWMAALGWQLRDYGKLEGTSGTAGRLSATDDVNLLTGSYNFGVSYRF